jgi:hypothetical protein
MRLVKTCIILGLSILLYYVAFLIRYMVIVVHDVKGQPGEYEYDIWGNIKANWRSDTLLFLSFALFVWFLVRVIRLFYKRSRA